jgi:serine/threonine-protein kinase
MPDDTRSAPPDESASAVSDRHTSTVVQEVAIRPPVARGYNGCLPAVPGYEILEELGRGGMGVVFRARQVALNRIVALKMILAGEEASPTDLERFRREAEAAAALDHPNIAQVFEVGTYRGRPYFTLEYVGGGSLRRYAKDPLPPRAAATIVEAIARGVAHAHSRGIIHRDLKPDNILLELGNAECGMRNDGRTPSSELRIPHSVFPKITDFGLAKDLGSGDSPTAPGAVLGTPSYMAPEQAAGDSNRVGPQTDVYALGAILYRLLSGRAPFAAPTPFETMHLVIFSDPPAPSELVPMLPRDLATICLKCLRKSPALRYESAAALADDLNRFLAGEPVRARRVSAPERAWKWVRRNRGPTAIAAGVFVALAAAAGVTSWQAAEAERARAVAVQRQGEADRARDEALAEKQRVSEQQTLAAAHLETAMDSLEPLTNDVLRGDVPRALQGFRRDYAERTSRFAKRLIADEKNPDRSARRQIGRAYQALAISQVVLGQKAEAEKSYLRAVAIQEQLVDEFPTDENHRIDLAITYYDLSDAYAARGDKTRAGETLAKIVPLFETMPRTGQRISHFELKLSQRLWDFGKTAEARVWLDRQIDSLRKFVREEKDPDLRRRVDGILGALQAMRFLIGVELAMKTAEEQKAK